MNAETTARRVLTWAANPRGLPPSGPLTGLPDLARPGPDTIEAARSLLRAGAARMGVGSPPLGDNGLAGSGFILLAAALGGRALGGPARRVAYASHPPRPAVDGRWSDAVARHLIAAPAQALVTPGRPATPEAARVQTGARTTASAPVAPGAQPPAADEEPLAEVLLRGSPLTCVLHRPPRARLRTGSTLAEAGTAVGLLSRRRGRTLLTGTLARWDADPDVLSWRAALLDLLVTEHGDAVVETYIYARTLHAAQWDRRLAEARIGLSRSSSVPEEQHLAAVRYWVPLTRMLGRRPGLLRDHPFLDGCQFAGKLVARYRPSVGAAYE